MHVIGNCVSPSGVHACSVRTTKPHTAACLHNLCTGTKIQVGVDAALLLASKQRASALSSSGVDIGTAPVDCQASGSMSSKDTRSPGAVPLGVLVFCGNYDITLLRPIVQDMWLPAAADQPGVQGRPAPGSVQRSLLSGVLVFGGSVNASIVRGRLTGNRGTAVLLTGAATVRISDTVITDNVAVSGAGVRAHGHASVVIAGSLLSNNSASDSDAAAYTQPKGGRMLDMYADIRGCGGAVLAADSAGVNVTDSIIGNCSASAWGGGAAAFGASSISFVNVTVQLSNATSGGGAAAVGSAHIASISSSWLNNTCMEEGGGLLALANASIVALGSRFTGNTAKLAGGGVSVGCSCGWQVGCSCPVIAAADAPADGFMTTGPHGKFKDCKFTQNVGGVGAYNAQGTMGYAGGLAASNGADVRVQGCRFHNNTADSDGGAVWALNYANVSVAGCSFTDNYVGSVGAALVSHVGCTVNVSGSLFVRNAGNNEGGAAHFGDSVVTIVSSTFLASNGSKGGAFSGHGNQSISVYNSTIIGSMASEDCGVLMVYDSNAVLFSNTTIAGSTAAKTAGAICIYANSSLIVDAGSIVANNTAGNLAGALLSDGAASILFKHSVLENNTVQSTADTSRGGALVVQGNSTATLLNATAVGNSAVLGGFAAVIQGGSMAAKNSRVVGNVARLAGGAVFVGDAATVEINTSQLTNNSAVNGAGVAAFDKSAVALQDSILDQGFASQAGGCAYIQSTASMTFLNSTCRNSSSGLDGGGVYVAGKGRLQLLGASGIVENAAHRDGGGVALMDAAVLGMSKAATIAENDAAGGQGGGLAAISGGFQPKQVQLSVHNNSARYSRDLYANCTKLNVTGSASVKGFVSVLGGGGSWLPASLSVTGHYGLPCAGVSVQAQLVDGDTESFVGVNASDANGTVAFELRVRKPPGNYSVKFSVIDDRNFRKFPPAVMALEVVSCPAGMVTTSPDTCQVTAL